MLNRFTLILVVCALLLGVNIGLLLSGRNEAPVQFLPTATAGSPIMSAKGGQIFTCSEDGTKLYEWEPKSAGTNSPNPWIRTDHQ